jgi:hypothetical protein
MTTVTGDQVEVGGSIAEVGGWSALQNPPDDHGDQ